MSEQVMIAARRIANEIAFGDLNKADTMWKKETRNLKYFESLVLRDKIKNLVNELDTAKINLEAQKDLQK